MFGKRKSDKPSLLERAADTVRKAMQPQARAEAPAEPLRAPQTSVMLAPGRHVINGQVVYVQGAGETVAYPLEPGRHEIDNRVVIVARPGMFTF